MIFLVIWLLGVILILWPLEDIKYVPWDSIFSALLWPLSLTVILLGKVIYDIRKSINKPIVKP